MRIKKYINACQITASWVLSLIRNKPAVWGFPFSLGIELTNSCNLKCPECSSGSGLINRPLGFMSERLFDSIVSQLGIYMINTMFYFQGESMLHPKFFEFLEKSRGMGVVISTNGHFIDKENARRLANSGARKIIISMDGFTQATYSRYRVGGNIELVKSGVSHLVSAVQELDKSPDIVLQVLVNRYNEDEIDSIRKFAKSQNIKARLKSMQLLGISDHHEFLPSSRRYRRYTHNNGSLKPKVHLRNRCFRLWTNPVITWDGRVVPCCFDKSAVFDMGNLEERPFREIWNSEKFTDFRTKLLTGRKNIPICQNCTS